MKNVKLIHGDCLEKMKDIPDGSVDLILADPPFNLVSKMGNSIHLFRQSEVTGNDTYSDITMSYDVNFDQSKWINIAVAKVKKGGHFIIFNDWENMGCIAKTLRCNSFKVKSLNHWQKTNPQPAEWKRRFVPGREYFLHSIKPGAYTFNVKSIHHGVFTMSLTPGKEKMLSNHPNQKPIKLISDLICILTNEGDTVLDPFMGSGTTGVACVNLNRKFIGIELDDFYFDDACNRIDPTYRKPEDKKIDNYLDKFFKAKGK